MSRTIAVFLGSREGANPVYTEHAVEFAREMVAAGFHLVFGGSNVGLMGVLSDTVLAHGGTVTGVFPEGLFLKARAHSNVSKLHIVDTMHERKEKMAELADAFVALPGGLGTLEEIFEAITWTQIGIHNKPCGFLNSGGYYDKLFEFLDHATAQGFIQEKHRQMIFTANRPETLRNQLCELLAD